MCFFCSVLMLVVEAFELVGDRVEGEGANVDADAEAGFVAADVVAAVVAAADTACPFVVDQVRALGRADMSLQLLYERVPGRDDICLCGYSRARSAVLLVGGRPGRVYLY